MTKKSNSNRAYRHTSRSGGLSDSWSGSRYWFRSHTGIWLGYEYAVESGSGTECQSGSWSGK